MIKIIIFTIVWIAACESKLEYKLQSFRSFSFFKIKYCDSSNIEIVRFDITKKELTIRNDIPINKCDYYEMVEYINYLLTLNRVETVFFVGNGTIANNLFMDLVGNNLITQIEISLKEFKYNENNVIELDFDFSKFPWLKELTLKAGFSGQYNFRNFVLPNSLEFLNLNDFLLNEKHTIPFNNYKFKKLLLKWSGFAPKYLKNLNVDNLYIGVSVDDEEYQLLINNNKIKNLFTCAFSVKKPKELCLKSRKEKVIFYENCKWFPTFQELLDAIKQGKYKKKCNFPILNDYVKYFTYKSDPP